MNANAPAITQPELIQVCVLHDASGRVAHIHRIATFPGAKKSADAVVEARCREVAVQLGHDIKNLKALHVSGGELKPGMGYKVDVQKRKLVPLPQPARVMSSMPKKKPTQKPKKTTRRKKSR